MSEGTTRLHIVSLNRSYRALQTRKMAILLVHVSTTSLRDVVSNLR
jgi:hypothetical protein